MLDRQGPFECPGNYSSSLAAWIWPRVRQLQRDQSPRSRETEVTQPHQQGKSSAPSNFGVCLGSGLSEILNGLGHVLGKPDLHLALSQPAFEYAGLDVLH